MREQARWLRGLLLAGWIGWLAIGWLAIGWLGDGAQAAEVPSPPQALPLSQSEASLDERTQRLSAELRCLVCQNQTVADSQAELAMQLKREVRQQLARGASDQEVRDFMVQRYGDFVLYRPPLNDATVWLWGGPVLLLALGLCTLGWQLLRHRPDEGDTP